MEQKVIESDMLKYALLFLDSTLHYSKTGDISEWYYNGMKEMFEILVLDFGSSIYYLECSDYGKHSIKKCKDSEIWK